MVLNGVVRIGLDGMGITFHYNCQREHERHGRKTETLREMEVEARDPT